VSPPGAEAAVLVVPTDGEWEIARQALAVISRTAGSRLLNGESGPPHGESRRAAPDRIH
jgi:hypothetical protein